MNDRFVALQLFVKVARTGSFSTAGREMGFSQPTASRIIAGLEKQVGVSLFTRTTRAVTLTEAGLDYQLRAEEILTALDDADHAARGTGELRGVLRIAVSTSFAIRTILPRLDLFADQHPGLSIEFILSDERQDLVGSAVDVAVRIGPLTDSSATAKKIGAVCRMLAASPAYLARAGAPCTPGDLARHTLIVGPMGRKAEAWTFRKDGKTVAVRARGRYFMNGSEGAIAAAVAGLGIFSGGARAMERELQSGLLVRVLPEWEMGTADIHVILPAGRASKPSARAFSDFIAQEMLRLPVASRYAD